MCACSVENSCWSATHIQTSLITQWVRQFLPLLVSRRRFCLKLARHQLSSNVRSSCWLRLLSVGLLLRLRLLNYHIRLLLGVLGRRGRRTQQRLRRLLPYDNVFHVAQVRFGLTQILVLRRWGLVADGRAAGIVCCHEAVKLLLLEVLTLGHQVGDLACVVLAGARRCWRIGRVVWRHI